ncbi:zinc-binding dehydrogenase [Paeniglutamicibacter sp. MACA_103]
MLPAVGRGEIRPVIDSTFDKENHAQASARLLSGAAHGKIVLAIG